MTRSTRALALALAVGALLTGCGTGGAGVRTTAAPDPGGPSASASASAAGTSAATAAPTVSPTSPATTARTPAPRARTSAGPGSLLGGRRLQCPLGGGTLSACSTFSSVSGEEEGRQGDWLRGGSVSARLVDLAGHPTLVLRSSCTLLEVPFTDDGERLVPDTGRTRSTSLDCSAAHPAQARWLVRFVASPMEQRRLGRDGLVLTSGVTSITFGGPGGLVR